MALKDSISNAKLVVWRFVKSLVRHEGRMEWFSWLYGSEKPPDEDAS